MSEEGWWTRASLGSTKAHLGSTKAQNGEEILIKWPSSELSSEGALNMILYVLYMILYCFHMILNCFYTIWCGLYMFVLFSSIFMIIMITIVIISIVSLAMILEVGPHFSNILFFWNINVFPAYHRFSGIFREKWKLEFGAQKAASWISRWRKLIFWIWMLHIPGSKISNIIPKLPKKC